MQNIGQAKSVSCRWTLVRPLLFAAIAVTARTALATCNTCAEPVDGSKKLAIMSSEGETAYIAGSSSIAYVSTSDKESAKKLAHGIIEQKLAACVNIIPNIQSVYMWEGKINEDNEYLMMIKTRTSRIAELTKYVRENHPYSVAEVISVPIEAGNPPYLSWINDVVPAKSEKN